MEKECKEYAETGRCKREEKCKYLHTRCIAIEPVVCCLCTANPPECTTPCSHQFCYSCASSFMQQSTKCLICDEETDGVCLWT
ncbi:hypothetical protein NEDG_00651 [Nematocida displodere]|uniref:RING-type E3 ubiquitin transferase n=1 Tax=Nematocida displodere TaxID=1805483 RepID=A0A177ECH1_9MICR|nr:hypothetical protein NEDG_00651 [Nematocida displodere]